MKCVICKQGITQSGRATVTLQRGKTTVVICEVPADICDNCGEYYLSDPIAQEVLDMAEDAVQKGVQVEIREYVAA